MEEALGLLDCAERLHSVAARLIGWESGGNRVVIRWESGGDREVIGR